ncbi:hypothetical protein ACF0H5_010901 [Mactra antiquata]
MEILCESLNILRLRAEITPEMTDMVTNMNCFDTSRDADGDTLLHIAIISYQPGIAMSIISKYRFTAYLSVQNNLFQSALHLSVLTNQVEVCRMLIEAGAELESRDKDGNTALLIACRDGLLPVVQCLLGSVRHFENSSSTRNFNRKIQDLSIRNYLGYSNLHMAAMNGHLDIMALLIENGADINITEGKTGRTILHNACAVGDIHLVKTLLRYKICDINARAYDDYTPFDLARARGHDNVCTALAVAGANQSNSYMDIE